MPDCDCGYSKEKQLEYAWNWFSYHATQRITAFRLYLIVFGALVVALQSSLNDPQPTFISIIGGMGTLVTLMFFVLDFRNECLVNDAKKALIFHETAIVCAAGSADLKISQGKRSELFNHAVWFRIFFGACFILFIITWTCPELLHACAP